MTFFLQSHHAKFCRWHQLLLAFVWFAGLLFGSFFYHLSEPSFLFLMRGISFDSVSIVGLFLSGLFPFLFSAYAVVDSKPVLVFIVCFLKAFFFTLISLMLNFGFCDGGWLVQRLIMFHEILTIPVLYTFWCRILRLMGLPSASECMGWLSLVFLIMTLDCRLLDPFLTGLDIL